MSKNSYLFEVSVANEAHELHDLRNDSFRDRDLDSLEKGEVHTAIDRRFSELNRATNPNPKPRW
jgi:hypothetical protein